MSRNILIVSFVLVLTFSVFIRTVNHAFIIWDDDKNIYENPYISQYDLGGIKRYWKAPFIGLYIPVTYTVWSLIAYDAGTKVNFGAGPDPIIDATRFHLANVVLHTASVGLLILLFYWLLGRRDVFAAAIGASLFALHPLQVEPVAWATGLKDVLSGFLALICVLLYVAFTRILRRGSPGTAWTLYALALVVYVVALLSKPQLVVIPPIIAILLWSRESAPAGSLVASLSRPGKSEKKTRKTGKKKATSGKPGEAEKKIQPPSFLREVLLLAPFFLAALICVGVTVWAQPQNDAIFKFDAPPLPLRFVVALDALAFYISKLFFPFGLTVDYGRTPAKALELALSYPIWVLPLLVVPLLLRLKNHPRQYIAALAIALVAVGPILGFIPFGFQGQSTVADRYVYLAMVGLGFGLATFLTYTENALPRYAAVGLLPLMAWISFNQVKKWENSETLFTYARKVNPLSVASTYNLGLTYSKEQQYQMALDYYRRAIELKGDFSHPWNNTGYVLNTLRRYKDAIPYLEKAIELNPEYVGSYTDLGISHENLGDFEKAVACYDKALEVQPLNPPVFINLGLAHMGQRNWEKALYYLKKASTMQPNLFQPYSGLGDIYIKLENYPAAIEAYHNLVTLKPDNPRNWRALAYAYSNNGQFDLAIRHMERAVDMIRKTPTAGPEVVSLYERNLEGLRNGRPIRPETRKLPAGNREPAEKEQGSPGKPVPAAENPAR